MQANIKFYEIAKFGYYLPREKKRLHACSSEILEDLKSWALDCSLIVNTKTFTEDKSKGINRVFYADSCFSDDGDFILVLWNEIQNEDGKVFGIDPSSEPGSNKLFEQGFSSQNAIPGAPSYYWFFDDFTKVAAIKFGHSSLAKTSFERYINGFMSSYSKCRVFSNGHVVGFTEDGGYQEGCEQIRPMFRTVPIKDTNVSQELLFKRPRIRKYFIRQRFDLKAPDNRALIAKTLSKYLGNDTSNEGSKLIYQEIEFRPSQDELEKIIESYEEIPLDENVKKVGFVLEDGKKIGLDGVSVTRKIDLSIKRQEKEFISADSLLTALSTVKEQYISLVEPFASLSSDEKIVFEKQYEKAANDG